MPSKLVSSYHSAAAHLIWATRIKHQRQNPNLVYRWI